jgi:hypothetical protein
MMETSYLFFGIGMGVAIGSLTWFAGWIIGKVFKTFRYVAR